jgi:hypothetical protein
MNHPFIYVGCFVDFHVFQNAINGIRSNPLKNDIQYPHITFAYRPNEVDQSLFGTTIQFHIVGYGNNGKNEGVKVELSSSEPALQRMIEKLQTPHITIAVSSRGKPVDTRMLHFKEIEPITLTGEYGGYSKWGEVITEIRQESPLRKRWE